MKTTVDTREARRQLRVFLDRLGPEGDRVLVRVVRGLAGEGRRTFRTLTPVSAGPTRPPGRPRLRQNIKARTRKIREGGARAFVWYSRGGLRFQQALAVEHGARGKPGHLAAARSLDQVAGADGSHFRHRVLVAMDKATEAAAAAARLKRGGRG